MRLISTILLVILVGFTGYGQQFFTPISLDKVPTAVKSGERGIIPAEYTTYSIDFPGLVNSLQVDQPGKTQSLIFPVSEKEQLVFHMNEKSPMPASLQAKFPNIRTFIGKSENGEYSLYLNYSPYSVHAVMRSTKGVQYLIPFAEGVNTYANLCFRKDYIPQEGIPQVCGEDKYTMHADHQPLHELSFDDYHAHAKAGDPISLRSYRVAVACTAEFTTLKGGVAPAMAAINQAFMILNEIYHREVAIDFTLIDNNEQLIYTDSNTDPYTAPSDAAGLLAQNQVNLDNVLGTDGYDIGHVFTIGCINNLGGIAALGSVCNASTKGRGVTCHSSQNVANIVSEIMAHEIGHSFSATHSWIKCSDQFQNQNEPGTSYEPGGGTTIMSYAGACGPQNVQNNSDPYFHTANLEQILNYRTVGTGATCGIESGSNGTPDVTILSPGGVTIPISTPFKLTATATDPEGHDVNYCWEQFDLGPTADLGSPIGNGPSFRSFPPTTDPTRIFPRLQNVLAGTSTVTEVLPTYTREFNFRCTVRDLFLPNAGVSWELVSFDATEDAGPFVVSAPTGVSEWEVGSVQTITWDVANTNLAPVNCQTVNVWLSTDGGQNFDIQLATNVANSGSLEIVVPNQVTDIGRIMVESVGNIFFDINAGNFDITPASEAGIILGFENNNNQGEICLPGDAVFNLVTEALGGFNAAVNYSITGLPSGATSGFTQNPSTPDQNQALTISMDGTVAPGSYDLTLVAEATGLTTLMRNITVIALDQDFSSLATVSPANGATGVAENTSVSWTALGNADSYDVRISTSPAFDENLVEANGIAQTTFSPTQPFEKSTLYFWQVRTRNSCAVSDWSAISLFQTENFSCNSVTSSTALNIPAGTGVVESDLNVTLNGSISDINVIGIDIDYTPTTSLIISLVSPVATTEQLYNKNCSGTELNIGFDGDATSAIVCPPAGGTYLPDGGNLGNFTGENTQGDWKLRIETTVDAFDPGSLNEWTLEFCSNFTPSGPYVERNETILVKTDDAQWLSSSKLWIKDDDNTADELTYTIVRAPEHGTLENESGITLLIGDNFTQDDVNKYRIKYVDGSNSADADDFVFTVTDGTGGFLAPTTANFSIDDNYEPFSSVSTLSTDQFSLFPNPADQIIQLTSENIQADRIVTLIDSRGQLLNKFNWTAGKALELSTEAYPAGVYFLQIQEGNAIGTKRFSIIR